jgi:pimeloyl-ACP methyl ester carboxylesterase
MDLLAMAELFAKLMEGLGYTRFAIQAGNHGSAIGTYLARNIPDRIVGLHMNFVTLALQQPPDSSNDIDRAYTADLTARRSGAFALYGAIARNCPQTLAYGLNDSPLGLAAWIVEKFTEWAACDGQLDRAVSKDDLLTIIAIYWFTQSMPSSLRLYWEAGRRPLKFEQGKKIGVPCGVARMPKEPIIPPKHWIEHYYNVVHWTDMAEGGHFAPLEQPELLARDVRAFLHPLRSK